MMATNAKAHVKVRLASDVEDPTLLEEELNTVPTVRSTMTSEKTRAEAQFVDLEDAKKRRISWMVLLVALIVIAGIIAIGITFSRSDRIVITPVTIGASF